MTMDNCCSTCSRGHKGIVARKTWHGRFGYDGECESTIFPAPQQTKYLGKSILVRLQSSATSSEDFWTGTDPLTATPVHCSSTGEFLHERSVHCVVDRYSGVKTLHDCVEHKVGPVYTGSCDNGAYSPNNPASTGFDDINCGSPSFLIVPWADIFSMLDACAGRIKSGAPECATAGIEWDEYRTPSEIEAAYSGDAWNYDTTNNTDRLCETSGLVMQATGRATQITNVSCELSATVIEFHLQVTYTAEGHDWMVYEGTSSPYGPKRECALPTSTHNELSYTIDVVIQLDTPYTAAELNQDVKNLLGLRSLTDMTDYTWHYGCTYPLISRDEVTEAAGPDGFTHGDCSWTDPNGDAPNGVAGNGFTGAVLNGSGAISEWYSAVASTTPDGAYMDFKVIAGSQILQGCKYAEVLATRPAHNWYRPCGPDRQLLDLNGDPRYPDAWPICGHLTVTDATNASPIVITTDEDNYLQDGDLVDISGVGGNTAANGSDIYVKVLTPTTFELYSDAGLTTPIAGSGAYTTGGVVENAASTSPPSESWNDSDPKGDYLVLFYQFNIREGNYAEQEGDPIPRECNGTYSFGNDISLLSVIQGNIAPGAGSPRVVCISPNGENFGAAGVTHAFPDFANPLTIDWRFGSRWVGQVQQRMLDPISHAAEPVYVEARNSVPVGAPALPNISGGDPCRCGWLESGDGQCPFVHILTVAEITTLAGVAVASICPSYDCTVIGEGGEPQGIVAPPHFDCAAFDNDVP